MDTDVTPIAEQAAHWFVTLHDEQCTSGDRRAFAEWIAKSPERVEAYLRVTLLHRQKDQVRWPQTSAEDLIREARAAAAEVLPLASFHGASSALQSPRSRLWRPLALAATVLLAVAATWLYVVQRNTYRTDIGEQRSVLLDDGSLITLNTGSSIEVDFTRQLRRIHLTRGEALFDVAKDAERPFDVIVDGATIRAVGTQFNVDRREGRTTVTVIEGRVLVDEVPVAAAERVIVRAAQVSAPERIANVAPVTAWTQRRLVFERRPLSDVAEEFNRYNRRQIRIEDVELQREEVTGVFEANDAASFITFLEQLPDAQVQQASDGTYVVRGPN